MTKLAIFTLALLFSGVLAGHAAQATQNQIQPSPGSYNPYDEATINGTVKKIEQIPRTGGGATHISVATYMGTFDVHLGPVAFLEDQDVSPAAGDHVTITGSLTTVGGQQVLLAREITDKGKTAMLRDRDGNPLWAGPGSESGYGQQMVEGDANSADTGSGRILARTSSLYDANTVTSLSGTIEQVQSSCGPWRGSYAVLNTDTGNVNVMLGPAAFLSQNNLALKAGDQVDITGSMLDIDGIGVLVARSISSRGQTLQLRDEQGMPLWAAPTKIR